MNNDIELNSFIQDHIDSFVKWDILVYFSRIPEAVETIDSISKLTGKVPAEIERPLDDLVNSGVLRTSRNGQALLYYMVEPSFRRRDILQKVNTGMLDRGARLKLLTMAMESIKKQNGKEGLHHE